MSNKERARKIEDRQESIRRRSLNGFMVPTGVLGLSLSLSLSFSYLFSRKRRLPPEKKRRRLRVMMMVLKIRRRKEFAKRLLVSSLGS